MRIDAYYVLSKAGMIYYIVANAVNTIDKVMYWIDIAEQDIKVANAMLESKFYLYVGFMCHQAAEKMLKAYYSSQTEDVPRTHNLNKLAKTAGLLENMNNEQRKLLNILSPLNIEARYPNEKDELLKFLTHERCQCLIKETKEMISWIKAQLSL